MKGKVSEIFKSIQGEGIYLGYPQVFVRFFGCSLNCCFCDTKPQEYEELEPREIIGRVNKYKDFHSVALTGGEPLEQPEFARDLAGKLYDNGNRVYLETNGILPQALRKVIDYVDIVAMDIKLPSATCLGPFWREHEDFLQIAVRKNVFVKMVISRSTHISDVMRAIDIVKRVKPDVYVVLQPQHPYEDFLVGKLGLFQTICEQQKITAKIIAQTHKKMGVK